MLIILILRIHCLIIKCHLHVYQSSSRDILIFQLKFELQATSYHKRLRYTETETCNNSKELQRDNPFGGSNLQLRRSSYLKLMSHFTKQESDVEPNVAALCYNI